MTQHCDGADELITTFTQQRQVLLKRTANVLLEDAPRPGGKVSAREAQLSAILVSSLEELKVAEEELTERVAALSNLHDELEQHVRAARQLFDLAPTALLVTDTQAHILDANRACQMLLKRDFSSLERQPLIRYIPADERRSFRDGLSWIMTTEGAIDWRFMLIRPTDAPLMVSAAVRVVMAGGTPTGSKLFWSIRAMDPADASDA